MSKKILLVEADAAFAAELSAALQERGFDVRVAGDGKEGLDVARDERPDAVVLCVELPRMSGYSICQKLKKDEALKAIPLVLTSAEATPETFEQHKKLKARADEYLLKPFGPDALVEKLAALVGLPDAPAEEEVVTLDEEVAIEALGAPEEGALPRGGPVQSTSAPGLPEDDEDLKLLDDAFDSIAADGPPSAAPAEDEPAGAVALEVEVATEDPPRGARPPMELDGSPAGDRLDQLGADADAALAALGAELSLPIDGGDVDASPMRDEPARPVRGPSPAALRAAGIPMLDPEPAPARDPRPETTAAERTGEREIASLRSRLEQAERALSRKTRDAGEAIGKVEALERELETIKTELVAARAEAESARSDTEKRTAEMRKRLSDLEALNAKNEERILRAYQKIKADEKLREKTRKALTIALQLIDEVGAPADPADKPRGAAARIE